MKHQTEGKVGHTPGPAEREGFLAERGPLMPSEDKQSSTGISVKYLEVLKRTREDLNWMLNNGKLLNHFVFDYLDKAIEEAEQELRGER